MLLALHRRTERTWQEVAAYLGGHKSKPLPRLAASENLVRPLVRFASSRRHERLTEHAGIFSKAAEAAFREALQRRLSFCARDVAQYELTLFRNVRSVCGRRVGADRIAISFFGGDVEQQTLDVAQHYPELKRLWLCQIENWLEFLRTFTRDAAEFAQQSGSAKPVRITGLRLDVSDLHDDNRAVVQVRFGDRGDWYYKPRPARQSGTWFKLLSDINAAGFPLPFNVLRIVPRETHHWVEAVIGKRCRTRAEEANFWRRAGALIYLVHRLSGVDFHVGNLVAHGEHPVFVDCETLLHPETQLPTHVATRERGLFRTGLLPLGSGTGASTAAFQLETARRVVRRGAAIRASMVTDALREGFSAMHEFVATRGRLALRSALRQLRSAGCRLVYRTTAHYHHLLRRSLSPELLKSTSAREEFLRRGLRAPHLPARIAMREARALRDSDIPLFVERAGEPLNELSAQEVAGALQILERAMETSRDHHGQYVQR